MWSGPHIENLKYHVARLAACILQRAYAFINIIILFRIILISETSRYGILTPRMLSREGSPGMFSTPHPLNPAAQESRFSGRPEILPDCPQSTVAAPTWAQSEDMSTWTP